MDASISSAEYQGLCALLHQLRIDAGLIRVEVVARLDVPQSLVSKDESGERPDVITLKHFAAALETTL